MAESTAHADTELAAEIASGLRGLAVMIEANPDLARDMHYTVHDSLLAVLLEDQHARLAQWARAGKAAGAKVTKNASDSQFEVSVQFGLVRLRAIADRNEVCERVVVGTETVTKQVPDPAKLAEVPLVEVTETVEQVEWKCRPLLADDESREPVAAGSAVA